MTMKTQYKMNMWGLLLATSFTASMVLAQDVIADDELLKMLDGTTTNEAVELAAEPEIQPEVSAEEAEAVAVVEEASVEETVEVVAEPVVEEKEVVVEEKPEEAGMEEVLVTEEAVTESEVEEAEIDDLGMVTLDDGVEDSSGELISVRLNKVGLEEAINLFAQLSGANIIVPELAEAAQISVNLKDVEWRPALQSILDAYNYELYQKVAGSNVFSVRRRPPGAPEPQVVETFQLRYATVPNVAKLIRTLLPPDAKVSEFASRNMIVVKSSESSLGEVRSVLQTIDIVRQQVYIESKFMELSDGTQLDLGFDWKQLGLDEQGNGGLSASVGASAQSYADGRQVSSLGPADVVGNFTEHIFTSVLDVDQFNVVLNALESDRGVNVVSNPKIIVANEEHATISIVRKEPNLKEERKESLNDTQDNITFSLDPDMPFFEFGIKLDVIPSINTSSNITIGIKPSLTRKFGDKSAGPNNAFPIIDEKTVETVFNLASGQTAAIGGLTEVTDSIKERKIPLLGSIPLLGRLFSWKQTVSDQTETIIFVTVGLANTQDIDLQESLPEDSELARRRLIRDRNEKELRDQSRQYYEAVDNDKLDDSIQEITRDEDKRVVKRAKKTAKTN